MPMPIIRFPPSAAIHGSDQRTIHCRLGLGARPSWLECEMLEVYGFALGREHVPLGVLGGGGGKTGRA